MRDLPARVLQVVEALCREREPAIYFTPDGDVRLPTDEEIGAELELSPSTVRTHLNTADTLIDGNEKLDRRARIFIWYRHRQWELQNGARPGGEAA